MNALFLQIHIIRKIPQIFIYLQSKLVPVSKVQRTCDIFCLDLVQENFVLFFNHLNKVQCISTFCSHEGYHKKTNVRAFVCTIKFKYAKLLC